MTLDILPFILAIVAYFIGCLPTAYLLVRHTAGKDIRDHGSGNMGGMNTYEVTGKASTGVAVGIIDALKGLIAVRLAIALGVSFFGIAMVAVFVVMGHCFNVFFKFKGGRGLATATGAMLTLNPLPLILWGLMYLTGYFAIRRDIHVGAVSGTLGTMILLFTTPSLIINALMLVPVADVTQFKLMVWMICVIIFIRHIEPMRELFRKLGEEESG